MAIIMEQPQALGYYSLKLSNATEPSVPVGPPNTDEALSGFPARYDGERVWVGPDMAAKQDEWVVALTDQDKDHILQALRHFQGKGFILPTKDR